MFVPEATAGHDDLIPSFTSTLRRQSLLLEAYCTCVKQFHLLELGCIREGTVLKTVLYRHSTTTRIAFHPSVGCARSDVVSSDRECSIARYFAVPFYFFITRELVLHSHRS